MPVLIHTGPQRRKSLRDFPLHFAQTTSTAFHVLHAVEQVSNHRVSSHGTDTAQPQNEILCSKGLGGAALNRQAERKITEGFFSLRACVY